MNLKNTISILIWLFALCAPVCLFAQEKRAMTPDDLREWRKVTVSEISRNGQWVFTVDEPTHADGKRDGSVDDMTSDPHLQLFDAKGTCVREYCPVSKAQFSYYGSYLVFSTRVPDACRNLRSKKELEKLPMDTLRILHLKNNGVVREEMIDSLRNFKVAGETDWIAYQRFKKDSTLHVRMLGDTTEMRFGHVKEYGFSKKGASLYWLTDTALWVMDCCNRTPLLVKQGRGKFTKMSFDERPIGQQLAFFYSDAQKGTLPGTGVSLWMCRLPEGIAVNVGQPDFQSSTAEAQLLSDSVNAAFPDGWVVSPNSSLAFSKQGHRLFFGTAPAPRETDTIQAVSSRPDVQVWSWDECQEYLVQHTNREKDAKKTYLAVCQLNEGNKLMQIATKEYDSAQQTPERAGDWILLRNTKPYSLSSMWEAVTRCDYAAFNLNSGERREMRKADITSYRLSPSGRYAVGYTECDSLWRMLDLQTGRCAELTSPRTFRCWDEENDIPIWPSEKGRAYWVAPSGKTTAAIQPEEYVLISDGYDLYRFSVMAQIGESGALNAVRITTNGRENNIRYSLAELNNENRGKQVVATEVQYLNGFNTVTRTYGYYQMKNLLKPAAPVQLIGGEYTFSSLTKAQDAPVLTFRKSNFTQMPDVWRTDMKFSKPVQLSRMCDQQKPFIWGNVEMVHWTSYNGIHLDGLLYKPENFDPTKKYPLIVNFYERNSDNLYAARTPNPGRSTPDYHMYLSEGYVIFNPDVRYTTGHPGESCYDCVMSGVDSICALGFIDEKRIGATGHSWGGYQVAWLATRTNRFAAIESGAPVVNMFSAYGGIRWATGRARAFQYEHTQSRLGNTMWENPDIYAENSPLLQMHKVTTPILIMANDTDGHVPYTQGIEMFVAMKRLGKPSWLLNYTEEPHWPCKTANRVDFQIRLLQFFNHYLKGEEMPRWMSEGIKAVDQPYDLGY